MPVDPQQIPLSGIPFGILLMFFGSLLNNDLGLIIYNIGFLIFLLSIVIVFVQWFVSGGAVELLNLLPMIVILSIVLTLSTDFVSGTSSEYQTFTWPLIIIVLIVIFGFMLSQGSDMSFIIPFLPFIVGIGILGGVAGLLIWNDIVRGLAYSIGVLGISVVLIWLRVRKSQKLTPAAGEKTSILGSQGKMLSLVTPNQEGRVKVGGTIWRAQSDVKIEENESIEVVGIAENQLVLKVGPRN
ncbi:MAG: NfeD family protein [Candidatus Hodarchaeales archaeon]|jgi:membrane protein implicated in regulation of membrane protease activity